jgi:CRP-like cAMP-binding protein
MTVTLEHVDIGRLEQIRTLRRLFGSDSGVSTAPLAAFAAHVITVRIPAGTELHSPDEPVSDVYLVMEGELAVEYRGIGPRLFGPQGSVGILPSFAGITQGYHSWATRDTLALSWRVEDMLEIFEDHFELLLASLRTMSSEGIELRKQLSPHAGFSNVVADGPVCPVDALDLVERILALRQTFGLGHSHIDELAELARAANEVRYPPGTQLWAAGDEADTMLLMLCGRLHGATPEGLEFQLGAGDIAGGLGLVAELPRWFTATAQEHVVALSLDREVLIDLLEDQPELGFDFLRLMGSALLELRAQTTPQAETAA